MRRAGWMSLAVAASAFWCRTSQAIDAGEHGELGLVVFAPAGNFSEGPSTFDLIRSIDGVLREHTGLVVAVHDADVVAQTCPEGSFTCLIRRIAEPGRPLFAVLSLVPMEEKQARVSIVLIDVSRAQTCSSDDREENEACIVRTGVVARRVGPAIAQAGIAEFLIAFFKVDARASLSANGVWEPYGGVAIRFPASGFSIELDGKMIGVTSDGETSIEKLMPGVRRIRVSKPGFIAATAQITVSRNNVQRIELACVPEESPTSAFRTGMFWSGVGIAATGAALISVAIGNSISNDLVAGCLGSCSSGFIGFGGPSAPTGFDSPRDSRGLLIAPSGIALLSAGATWSVGSLIGSDDAPWIQLALGAVVLGLSYGVSAAVGSGTP